MTEHSAENDAPARRCTYHCNPRTNPATWVDWDGTLYCDDHAHLATADVTRIIPPDKGAT